jgi:hypothetical protein
VNGISLLEKGDGRELLKKHCRVIGISVKVIEELVKTELEQVGRIRRRGMFEKFDDIFSEAVDTSRTDNG